MAGHGTTSLSLTRSL